LLASAGAATIGSIAGSEPTGAAVPGDPNAGAAPPEPSISPGSSVAEAFTTADPTLEYVSIHNGDWVPYDWPSTALSYVPGGGMRTYGNVRIPIHLPHGSVLKRVQLPIDPKSLNPEFRITRYDGSSKSFLNASDPVTVAGNTFTTATLESDVVIDNVSFSYEIQLRLKGAEVWGGRLAYLPPTRPLHSISPARVYDSRKSGGPLAPNTSRVISVRDGLDDTGAVTIPNVVPVGATAIVYNLTVTGTTGSNFLSVTPGGTASALASSVNFGGGVDIANASVVGIDANREIRVFCGDQSGSTHVIIDVAGYYR
jgi:hypothetical protein